MPDPRAVPTALLAALLLWAAPEPGQERGIVEVSVAAEILYPPATKDPPTHPSYGAGIGASLHTDSRFKAIVGFGFDHVVSAWLGEDDAVPRDGAWTGTRPTSFRGQLLRMTSQTRLGIDNDFAYGYFGLSPGYALRTAPLTCVTAPCRASRVVDHGLNLGLSLGALLSPSARLGVLIGAEVGLDWAWFPHGHPSLAVWNQAMHARLVAGWRF